MPGGGGGGMGCVLTDDLALAGVAAAVGSGHAGRPGGGGAGAGTSGDRPHGTGPGRLVIAPGGCRGRGCGGSERGRPPPRVAAQPHPPSPSPTIQTHCLWGRACPRLRRARTGAAAYGSLPGQDRPRVVATTLVIRRGGREGGKAVGTGGAAGRDAQGPVRWGGCVAPGRGRRARATSASCRCTGCAQAADA